jgi:hypothetical protein
MQGPGKGTGLQAKTPFAASLRADGEEREWVSAPGCGPVSNCKSRRRLLNLVVNVRDAMRVGDMLAIPKRNIERGRARIHRMA